ncbi:MAG: NADH:ubiquinone oxidoreductase [candidate division Zixibacteria bacterium 4484_95]|nr:MAG: NADH:ubiquinone oxidoreductase [candidate division Zixibacteria bacterium 4484_95]RLB92629.1 MAG: NADH-quinone oxidoreductase subunit C [Deltaproteobacteria bacterium]RLC08907.1 MAG: NADH-quinone oxidoreductase subunit C [Deltaproteobacteria bacterium]RLF30582.1 MAG: NADH-quinone oxidoreductase subunit C [Thermoplasmata archaeon]
MASKEEVFLEKVSSKFEVEGKIQRERRIWLSTDKVNLIPLCTWLKGEGFIHLSALSVTDWLEEGKYEVTYHLWSYEDRILVTVKTKIDRENPVIDSVVSLWDANAQAHEREMHELFGIKFEGNPNLTPLFLENWEGPPPFRKDFNWREYVKEKYYHKDDDTERVYYD